MGRRGSYVLAGILGLLCVLSGVRAFELLVFGGWSSYNAGRITGQLLLTIICGWGAYKFVLRARASGS